MKTKNFIILLVVLLVAIGGLYWMGSRSNKFQVSNDQISSAVTFIGEQQVIDITAKGGYSPRQVIAKEHVPTTLRVSTNGSYDCSTALVIPQLGFNAYLQPTGVEEIQISADKATGKLRGLCSMGMYSFEIVFSG